MLLFTLTSVLTATKFGIKIHTGEIHTEHPVRFKHFLRVEEEMRREIKKSAEWVRPNARAAHGLLECVTRHLGAAAAPSSLTSPASASVRRRRRHCLAWRARGKCIRGWPAAAEKRLSNQSDTHTHKPPCVRAWENGTRQGVRQS